MLSTLQALKAAPSAAIRADANQLMLLEKGRSLSFSMFSLMLCGQLLAEYEQRTTKARPWILVYNKPLAESQRPGASLSQVQFLLLSRGLQTHSHMLVEWCFVVENVDRNTSHEDTWTWSSQGLNCSIGTQMQLDAVSISYIQLLSMV